MKIKSLSILALSLIASVSANAVEYLLYKGSGDTSDVSNYYYLSGSAGNNNTIPVYPSDYTGSFSVKGDGGGYGIIKEVPANFDMSTVTICYMRYEVGVVDESNTANITFSEKFASASDYGKVYFTENFNAKKIISRSYWNTQRQFVIGSANSAETTFSVEDSFGVYYTSGSGFKVADDAKDNINNLDFGEFIAAGAKNTVIGDSTGFFDNVNIGTITLKSNGSLIIYADKLTVGSADMSSNSDDTCTINFAISEDALANDGTIFSFGSLKKDETAKLTLDFSGANLTKEDAGVYDIFEADTLTGFDISGLDDFVVQGLDDKDFASLAWNGNTIQLTIVPEPSTVAAIFGVFALAFVAYRRRK